MNLAKKLLVVSCVSSSIFLASCATSQNTSSSVNHNLSQIKTQIAIEQIRNGSLDLAKSALDEAIDKNPSNPNAYMYMGIVYQLDPTHENNKKADGYYKKAISLDPENPTIRNNYGQYLYKSARFNEAISQFNVSSSNIAYTGRTIAFSNLGYSFYNLGQYDEALRAFKNSLNLNQENVDALLGASMSLYALKRFNESESAFKDYQDLVDINNMDAKGLWLGMILANEFDNYVELKRMGDLLKAKFPQSQQYAKYTNQVANNKKLSDL